MTALIDPTRPAAPRHRRPDEDPTDDVGVPVADGWLDPATAPLAVYRDRDLPYAPLAVQRDRARVVPAAPVVGRVAAAPATRALPGTMVRAAPVPTSRTVAAVARTAAASVDRLGRARVAAVALIAAAVVLAAVAVVLLSGGPSGGRPGPGVAPAASTHVLPARVS